MARDAIPTNLLSFSSYIHGWILKGTETDLGILEDFMPWPCDCSVTYLRVNCVGRVV